MRKSLFLFFCLLPAFLFSQKDTIRISKLEQPIFGKAQIKSILFDEVSRPINFFYSNVFNYHNKPFTGIAIEKTSAERDQMMELKDGRIIRFIEHSRYYQKNLYCFYRIDRDSILALDSLFENCWNGYCYSSTRLIKRGNELRMQSSFHFPGVYNGYFPRCTDEKNCTNDGYSFIQIRDGYQKETFNARRECVYKDGKQIVPWTEYYADSSVAAVYYTDDDNAYDGYYIYYWKTGKKREEGSFQKDSKIGVWLYYDTTGRVEKNEWYSAENHLDSAKTYFANGKIYSIQRIIGSRESYTYKKKIYFDEWEYTNKVTTYYPSGARKSIDGYGDKKDTLYALWYPDGTLWKIHLDYDYQGRSEYYPNGQIKSQGLFPWYNRARDLHVKQWDSTGKLLIDRTYRGGKLISVNDENFGKIDSVRLKLADQLAGAAAIGLYASSMVAKDFMQTSPSYSANVDLVSWADSVFIPQKILDSISYSVAGIYLAMDDSLIAWRDSVFSFAREFHPSPNEWYYTIQLMVNDSGVWMQNCRNGKMITGDNLLDVYLEQLHYTIISTSAVINPCSKRAFATVVINIPKPLNLNYANSQASTSRAFFYCGKQATVRYLNYLLFGQCFPEGGHLCTSYNYLEFDIYLTREQIPGDKRGYIILRFFISSDQTVDYKGLSFYP